MPRGNLETIHHRALVLAQLRTWLDRYFTFRKTSDSAVYTKRILTFFKIKIRIKVLFPKNILYCVICLLKNVKNNSWKIKWFDLNHFAVLFVSVSDLKMLLTAWGSWGSTSTSFMTTIQLWVTSLCCHFLFPITSKHILLHHGLHFLSENGNKWITLLPSTPIPWFLSQVFLANIEMFLKQIDSINYINLFLTELK